MHQSIVRLFLPSSKMEVDSFLVDAESSLQHTAICSLMFRKAGALHRLSTVSHLLFQRQKILSLGSKWMYCHDWGSTRRQRATPWAAAALLVTKGRITIFILHQCATGEHANIISMATFHFLHTCWQASHLHLPHPHSFFLIYLFYIISCPIISLLHYNLLYFVFSNILLHYCAQNGTVWVAKLQSI